MQNRRDFLKLMSVASSALAVPSLAGAAVFFASASAVESFIANWGSEALQGKTILAMGKPTAR